MDASTIGMIAFAAVLILLALRAQPTAALLWGARPRLKDFEGLFCL